MESAFGDAAEAEVVVVNIDFVGGEADQGFGFVGDAFGLEGADLFAINKDLDLVATGAGSEGVPLLQVEFHGHAGGFAFQHFFLVGGEAIGQLFAGVKVVLQSEGTGLCVAHADLGGADGDLADVTGVGAFVIFVVKPDVKVAHLVADELEFHFDLEVLLALKLDVFDGGMVGAVWGDADENTVTHDAAAFVVSPAGVEAVAREIIGKKLATVIAGVFALLALDVPGFQPGLIFGGELSERDFKGAQVDVDFDDAVLSEVEQFGFDGFAVGVGEVAELASVGGQG